MKKQKTLFQKRMGALWSYIRPVAKVVAWLTMVLIGTMLFQALYDAGIPGWVFAVIFFGSAGFLLYLHAVDKDWI